MTNERERGKNSQKEVKLFLNHAKMSCCNISSALSTSPVCVKRSSTEDPVSAASTVHPLPHNCARLSSPSMAPVPSAVAVAFESDDEEARKASIDDQKAAISFASGSTFAFGVSLVPLPSTSSAKPVIGCCGGGDFLGGSDVHESTWPKSRSRPSENASLLLSSGLEGGSGEDGGSVSDHNKRCATVPWSPSSSLSSSTSSSLTPLCSFSRALPPSRPVSSSSSEAAGSESAGVSADASPSSLVLVPVPATAGSLISIRVPTSLLLHRNGNAGLSTSIPRPLSTLWMGENTCAALVSFKVFPSSSSSASGENSGLPLAENIAGVNGVARSPRRNEAPAGLRVGVHGTMTGAGTAVVGDELETCGGGGDDDRKTSAAAAMMGAAVLIPTLALLLPNDTRRGCVDADEG